MGDVTRILADIEPGDRPAAGQLLPLVYDELRKLAAARLAREARGSRSRPRRWSTSRRRRRRCRGSMTSTASIQNAKSPDAWRKASWRGEDVGRCRHSAQATGPQNPGDCKIEGAIRSAIPPWPES